MSPEPSSVPPPSSESSTSTPSSRVVSPSMTALSEFSNSPSHITTNSSSTSLVMPATTTLADSTSSLIDGVASQPHSSTQTDLRYVNGDSPSSTSPSQSQTPDVDPQIIEALRNKDRLYVLKLGEIMEGLIRDRKGKAELTPSTSYQRLLVHRCSAYYKITPDANNVTKTITISFSAESRIPGRRLADLVPAEPTPQPAFKIMRRSQPDRRVKPQSQTGSVTGEDADSSDFEPSEAGSMGGRSNATGGSSKKRMTIEERTAAYQEARSRIFMGFDEKDKEKEKDTSASSSSGLTSASASHAGSSVGDADDATSSLATESEWSAASFNKKDSRRFNPSSATRSLRSSTVPFTNGSGTSSRNSRAPSPSFTYASLYEPPPSSPSYDGAHVGGQHSAPGYQNPPPFMYPYPPPSQPPNQPFIPPYPYYPYPYGQPPPQPPQQNTPDAPPPGEMYPPPPPQPSAPHPMYTNSYMWPPPPNAPSMHSAPPMPTQPPNGQMPGPPAQPPQHAQTYPPYMHPSPPYSYPMMPGFYTPPHGPVHSAPSAGGQYFEDPRMMPAPGNVNGHAGNNNSQRGNVNQRGMPRGGAMNGGGKRSNAPLPRQAWSYGPGVGMGGVPMNGSTSAGSNGGGETVGPRLNPAMRRASNTSTGSSGYRASANDDVASTASSSTSSSSRRTYTSTTSSQHPLPARPDWAVGLKPDPTLHATNRHHDHSHNNSRNMSPISPPRTLGGGPSTPNRRSNQDQVIPTYLQSNDFPPLSVTSPEKRTPAAGGAWTNNSTRSLLMTPPTQTSPGNVVNHPGIVHPNVIANSNSLSRLDDGFERPPPKATELYNPKVVKRPPNLDNKTMNVSVEKNKGVEGGLTEQMRSMHLTEAPQELSS